MNDSTKDPYDDLCKICGIQVESHINTACEEFQFAHGLTHEELERRRAAQLLPPWKTALANRPRAVPTADEVRIRLHETFKDYAEQAELAREWERASAFRTAADLALAYVVKVG